MHILKSNSLRTTCSYIYTIPYIPFINHLAISYACILPIYYLTTCYIYIYTLPMGYLHKTYILSKCNVETIYRSIYVYILSICYLYASYILFYMSTTYHAPVFSFFAYLIYIYIYQLFIYHIYIYHTHIYIYISQIYIYITNIYIYIYHKYIYIYHKYIYIYTHYTVYTCAYLVSYTILCQYSPHTPDRTHPQGAGGEVAIPGNQGALDPN